MPREIESLRSAHCARLQGGSRGWSPFVALGRCRPAQPRGRRQWPRTARRSASRTRRRTRGRLRSTWRLRSRRRGVRCGRRLPRFCGYARRRAPTVEKSGVPCFGLSDRAPTPRLFWCTTKHAPPRQLRGLAESEIPLGNARLSCFVFGDTNSEGAPFVPPPTTTASGACRGA